MIRRLSAIGGRARAAILLAAALSCLSAGAARAQFFGQNKVQYRNYDWRSIRSDHFEVYFYSGLDSLAMRVLDLAEKTHADLSRRMGHSLDRPVPLILYGSHNDFSQTNVTPELIDEGTGGFTEALRNRVVLPFTGSYEDLRHVVVHELVHAIMFDMIYGGSAAALIARQSFFPVPLWFAEGMAEYFSLGMEPNAEMFLRDGIVEGYLPPLAYSGGYLVYKQGQSAISYLVERHGEERLRDVLRRIRQHRNFDAAFQRSVGSSVSRFDEQWRDWLRRKYWPTVARKDDPDHFARRLTDHRHDPSYLNTAPAVSPQGDRIAYFSDRRQYMDVYVMSALDGRVVRRVIRGERNVQFERIPSLRSALTWSPDGRRLALTAKSGGHDMLYVVNVTSGRTEARVDLPVDAMLYPAWAPASDSLVVVGVKDGRSDLWLVDLHGGAPRRLTDDTWDEKEPTWSPDGRRVTFASDRTAPVVLHPRAGEGGFGRTAIYDLDLESGAIVKRVDIGGNDHAPAWAPDGRRLAFVSDRDGASNIYLYDTADSSCLQLTDVLGGVQSLSWSRQNDRLVFSAFTDGGFDVFAVKEPLTVDGVLARLRERAPGAVLGADDAARAPAAPEPPVVGALGVPAWPDSVIAAADTLRADFRPDPMLVMSGHADTLGGAREGGWTPPGATLGDVLAEAPPPAPDSASGGITAHTPLVDRGGPFALSDSVLSQQPRPYEVHLAPDYAGGGFYASPGYEFVGSMQFAFSDFLGDQSLYLATDVFSNSLEDLNALAYYSYLPGRWDFGTGMFHFKSYYSSRVTSLGEQFESPRLFSERTWGALVTASYPFDRFHRAELNLTQMFVERTFFEEDAFGVLNEAGTSARSVSQPSLSLVGDNTLMGLYGPVNGQRYNLTYSTAVGLFDDALSYRTLTYDGRRYWDLTGGYTFAARMLAGVSGGRDVQSFRVGGFSTLRGFPDYDLVGSRMAITNLELRFPFIHQLGLVGPLPLGIFNLRGAAFTDVGAIWNEGEHLSLTRRVNGTRRLTDPRLGPGVGVGFGVGMRTAISFLILKLDCAWRTDLADVSAPRWHFSLGPEF